jgi:branched-chain amino acid transport system ATP-binding protein
MILEISKLTVWYESLFGDIRSLDRCSLGVHKGRITCLLGVNGSGKTTLLRTLSGVIEDYDGKITHGEISFDGKKIIGFRPSHIVALGIGHAPQDRHIFYTLSIKDNLLLGAYMQRKGKGAGMIMDKAMQDVFDLFPVLQERQHQKSGTLSGGEQQMLSIARALMGAPRLLLLDEPFLGLAPIVIGEILNALERLKRKDLTILLAEQNAKAALSIADNGYVMDEGFIVARGEAQELLTSSKVREIYFGEN